jgi:hypothetical protein
MFYKFIDVNQLALQELQRELIDLKGRVDNQGATAAIQELQREVVDLKGRVDHQGNALGAVFGKIEETGSALSETATKLGETVGRVDKLEVMVEEEHDKNVSAFADNSERQDFQSNQSKSNCVLITGMKFKIVKKC